MATTTNPTTIVCVFDSLNQAQTAVQDLVQAGVSRQDISLIAHDGKGEYASSLPQTNDVQKTTDGTTVGQNVTAGAGIGALGGLLLGLGALAIPGIGPIIAAGPLAAALGGAAVGAAGGGVIGTLKDSGVPDDDAQFYGEALRRGGVVVAVHAEPGQEERISGILEQHDAVEVGERTREYRESGWSSATPQAETSPVARSTRALSTEPVAKTLETGEQSIPVVEESLVVGKRAVQRGGVRVFTRLVETPVEEQVTLHGETVHVERRPVSRPATEADFHPSEDVIELTETDEVAVVGKRAIVTEEIHIGKEATERTETIHDTVRRTEVEVEQIGVTGSGATRFAGYETDFRSDFQTRFGKVKGAKYETYAPAYQYGSQMARDPRYQGKSYDALESTLQTDYLRQNPNSTWDNVKGAVRYGWEKVTGKR